jgi:hypothetical protein
MYLRRLLCAVSAALIVSALATGVALPAGASCGHGGYAYAGMQASRNAFGVSATLTAVTQPLVERGHVAAWVGVGGPGEGPNRSNEWLQIGLNVIAGRTGTLYYEVARFSGIHYVELNRHVPAGRRFEVAVLEMASHPSIWRIWVNGRAASRPIWLPESHGSLTSMAIAENLAGGVPSCNRFEYRFAHLALAGTPGGSWEPFRRRDADVLQDPGSRMVPAGADGFLATAAAHPTASPAAKFLQGTGVLSHR